MTVFESWLSTKLQELQTDESVFLPYIISILEGEEESDEEKREGLTGILSDCLDNEDAIQQALEDIMKNWKKYADSNKDSSEAVTDEIKKLDITEKMHAITQEKIANSKVRKVEKSEEQKKIKEAILLGYGNEGSEGSDDDNDEAGDLGPANTNAESVQKVE